MTQVKLEKLKTLEARAAARRAGLADDRAKAPGKPARRPVPLERGTEMQDGFSCGARRQDLRGHHPGVEYVGQSLADDFLAAGADKLLAVLALRRAAQILEAYLTRAEVLKRDKGIM